MNLRSLRLQRDPGRNDLRCRAPVQVSQLPVAACLLWSLQAREGKHRHCFRVEAPLTKNESRRMSRRTPRSTLRFKFNHGTQMTLPRPPRSVRARGARTADGIKYQLAWRSIDPTPRTVTYLLSRATEVRCVQNVLLAFLDFKKSHNFPVLS